MNRIDPRVKQLVRENKNTRLHVLIVLWAMEAPSTAADIATEINCSSDTVQAMLPRMESDGYVSRIGAGRHPRWTLTDKARQLHFPNLLQSEGEKITLSPSSSSDLSVLDSNLIKSDSEEEETEAEKRLKEHIANRYNLTGDKRADFLADAWATPERFIAWMYIIAQGKRDRGQKIRYPEAYALKCLSKRDEPDAYAIGIAQKEIDTITWSVPSLRELFYEPETVEEPIEPETVEEPIEPVTVEEPIEPETVEEPIEPKIKLTIIYKTPQQRIEEEQQRLSEAFRLRRIENDRRRKTGERLL
jgi:DNA-binding MarR family transcriptional regulator